MDKTGWTDKTRFYLAFEKEAFFAEENTPQRHDLNATRERLQKHLLEVGRDADIDGILAVELAILENDKLHYANSSGMHSSLDAGIGELRQCQYMLEAVRDHEHYAKIDRSLSLPKSRLGLLPLDDARKAFRGHATRLTNLDKAGLNELAKTNLKVRHRNMGVAEKLYIGLQRDALGVVAAEKAKSSGMEM